MASPGYVSHPSIFPGIRVKQENHKVWQLPRLCLSQMDPVECREMQSCHPLLCCRPALHPGGLQGKRGMLEWLSQCNGLRLINNLHATEAGDAQYSSGFSLCFCDLFARQLLALRFTSSPDLLATSKCNWLHINSPALHC